MLEVFHGTCSFFDRFEQTNSRVVNDFYGGGVAYFTDDRNIAKKYASSMSKVKNVNSRIVYTVKLSLKRTFDVDKVFTGKELLGFYKPSESEKFARDAGLLKFGVDKFQVIADLKTGNIKLRGDEIFRGLSLGMIKTKNAREKLISLGFDSLRYNGNQNKLSEKNHNVYLVYNSNDITITDRTLLINKLYNEHLPNHNIKFSVEED